jgi:hypothetical protein
MTITNIILNPMKRRDYVEQSEIAATRSFQFGRQKACNKHDVGNVSKRKVETNQTNSIQKAN